MVSETVRHAAVTMFPLPFLALGYLAGGWAVWVALGYVTVALIAFDAFLMPEREAPAPENAQETDWLSLLLGIVHFPVLFTAIWSLSGRGTGLASIEGIALYLATGFYLGQVSNSVGHELIHRAGRLQRRLGRWIFISLLFGHHSSAHQLVHHVHVATPNDPNSARLNESFYRFFLRAWAGSFRKGYLAEAAKLRGQGRSPMAWGNPYLSYVAGAALCLGLSYMIAGWRGAAIHLGLAGFAQLQLLSSDYVQHYGLQRPKLAAGKYAPVGPEHSWNAPHPVSRRWMLSAPRHSDHHAHPQKPYTKLKAIENTPTLPYSLPRMGLMALFPRRWKSRMTPLALQWQPGGTR